MQVHKAKAIIFDIDETLSPDISWLALTKGLGGSVEEHLATYEAYKNEEIDYETSKNDLLTIWQETGNANYDYFRTLFEQIPMDGDAKRVVSALAKQYDICLITGSMDLYAQVLAKKLGIETWFANTTLHWANGKLVDFDYELNQAAKKLEQFLDYCKQKGYEPEECIVIGDGANDLLMFNASKHGVLVGTDYAEGLRSQAWKIAPKLSDVLDVLTVPV